VADPGCIAASDQIAYQRGDAGSKAYVDRIAVALTKDHAMFSWLMFCAIHMVSSMLVKTEECSIAPTLMHVLGVSGILNASRLHHLVT
jgi:hypothetical protein